MSNKLRKNNLENNCWQRLSAKYKEKVAGQQLKIYTFGVVVYQEKITLVKHYQRGWEFPGGEQYGSEQAGTCLQRLVATQTGLKISSPTYIGCTEGKSSTKNIQQHSYTFYFFAQAQKIQSVPPTPDITEIALVTLDEARYLFRESAAELGRKTNHQQVLDHCAQQNLLSNTSHLQHGVFMIPPQPENTYRLNISRSFSSLYKMVRKLDTGKGKKPYFEYDDKRIYLSMSDR